MLLESGVCRVSVLLLASPCRRETIERSGNQCLCLCLVEQSEICSREIASRTATLLKKQYSGSLRLIWCNASDLITLFAFCPPDRTSIPQCTSTFTTPLPPPPFLHLYYSRPGMAASRVRSVERKGRFARCRVGARGWWCCSTGSGRGPVGARGEEGWVGCFERVSTCEWGRGFAVWITDVPVES